MWLSSISYKGVTSIVSLTFPGVGHPEAQQPHPLTLMHPILLFFPSMFMCASLSRLSAEERSCRGHGVIIGSYTPVLCPLIYPSGSEFITVTKSKDGRKDGEGIFCSYAFISSIPLRQQMFLIIYVYVCIYTCIHVHILYIHKHRSYTFVCVYILYIYTTEDYLGHSRYSVNFLPVGN